MWLEFFVLSYLLASSPFTRYEHSANLNGPSLSSWPHNISTTSPQSQTTNQTNTLTLSKPVTSNAATSSTSSSSRSLIPVLVGGTALTFTPNSVTAQPGDVIQFQFAARNHTVTESLQDTPCQPIDANSTAVNGVHSGFIAFDAASGNVGTFDVPVKDTKPMFLYCAQATHCQSGMVMMING